MNFKRSLAVLLAATTVLGGCSAAGTTGTAAETDTAAVAAETKEAGNSEKTVIEY